MLHHFEISETVDKHPRGIKTGSFKRTGTAMAQDFSVGILNARKPRKSNFGSFLSSMATISNNVDVNCRFNKKSEFIYIGRIGEGKIGRLM